MDDVKRPTIKGTDITDYSATPRPDYSYDSSKSDSDSRKPINVTDHNDNDSSSYGAYSSDSTDKDAQNSAKSDNPESENDNRAETNTYPPENTEPTNQPEPASEPTTVIASEDTSANTEVNNDAPIFDNPDTALEKPSDNESSQKGAGLDLSSLSNDDAQELGIPKSTKDDAEMPRSAMSATKPKHSNKSTFIVVAILVALALIGGAGYAYMQSNKKTKSSSQAPAVTPEPAPQKATTDVKAADIDKTNTDIDASLKKVDDTKDFAATDLTDSTLGLQ